MRLSQNAVHRALEETFRNSNIGDIYHGSEITAVKVGNNSKRSFENYIGGERNLTSEDEMAFDVLVHIADDGHVSSEAGLRAILESPIRDTKLPLGAEVKVGKECFELKRVLACAAKLCRARSRGKWKSMECNP